MPNLRAVGVRCHSLRASPQSGAPFSRLPALGDTKAAGSHREDVWVLFQLSGGTG